MLTILWNSFILFYLKQKMTKKIMLSSIYVKRNFVEFYNKTWILYIRKFTLNILDSNKEFLLDNGINIKAYTENKATANNDILCILNWKLFLRFTTCEVWNKESNALSVTYSSIFVLNVEH